MVFLSLAAVKGNPNLLNTILKLLDGVTDSQMVIGMNGTLSGTLGLGEWFGVKDPCSLFEPRDLILCAGNPNFYLIIV